MVVNPIGVFWSYLNFTSPLGFLPTTGFSFIYSSREAFCSGVASFTALSNELNILFVDSLDSVIDMLVINNHLASVIMSELLLSESLLIKS